MRIELDHYRTGSTNTNGSIDADVLITDDAGNELEGEITLLRDGCSGLWSSWGTRDHWLSDSLRHLDRDTLRDIVATVNQAACDRVEPEVYPAPERIEYDRNGHPI